MFTLYLDGTGPKISFPSDLPVQTKNNPSFTWTSSEPATFKCAVNGGQFVDCGNGTNGKWTGFNIPDGPYKLFVYGTDDMNNRGRTEQHKFIVGELIANIRVDVISMLAFFYSHLALTQTKDKGVCQKAIVCASRLFLAIGCHILCQSSDQASYLFFTSVSKIYPER